MVYQFNKVKNQINFILNILIMIGSTKNFIVIIIGISLLFRNIVYGIQLKVMDP
jgi:hypothetical protein